MVFTGIFSVPVDQSYNPERKLSFYNPDDDEYLLISQIEANTLVDKNLLSRPDSIFSLRGPERVPDDSQLQVKENKRRKESIWPESEIVIKCKNEKISTILSDSWRNKLSCLKSSTEKDIAIKLKSISPTKKIKFSELFNASPNVKKHSSALKVENSRIFKAPAITLFK